MSLQFLHINQVIYYPINLDLRGRLVVVIGGGKVAWQKVQSLLEAGAKVRVIDPKPLAELQRLARKSIIELITKPYRRGDLREAVLAIAATDDMRVNRDVYLEGKFRKIWVNAVDKPDLCDFTVPAIVRRGELQVTVSTGGASPALSKKLRQDLEKQFGKEYAVLLQILRRLRESFPSGGKERQERLSRLIHSDILDMIRKKKAKKVDSLLSKYFGVDTSLKSLGCKL